jgi:hypothetical protein
MTGQKAEFAQLDFRFRKERAIGRNIAVVIDKDGPLFAAQDCVPANVDVLAQQKPTVLLSFGVQNRIIVDKTVLSQRDLVRMPQSDISAEDNTPADFLEKTGIEDPAHGQAEGARNPGKKELDELKADEFPDILLAQEKGSILSKKRFFPGQKLFLGAPPEFPVHRHSSTSGTAYLYHKTGRESPEFSTKHLPSRDASMLGERGWRGSGLLLGEEARVLGEEVRRRLSGHGFSTEGREERRMSRSEFPRWGNERADESQTRALQGVNRDRTPGTKIKMESIQE